IDADKDGQPDPDKWKLAETPSGGPARPEAPAAAPASGDPPAAPASEAAPSAPPSAAAPAAEK
ncbi:hypothetical protein L6V77_32270, partial [Myxococcota bacterium]|nr:hypothetical protein [Myxococcota bacterium]